MSGAQEFAASDPALKIYVSGEGGPQWQSVWAKGRAGLVTLRDGDKFRVGNIEFTAVHTPGHTPEHVTYLVTDLGGGADEPMAAMTGDFLFVGDVGRPDLLEQAAGLAGAQEPAAPNLRRRDVARRRLHALAQRARSFSPMNLTAYEIRPPPPHRRAPRLHGCCARADDHHFSPRERPARASHAAQGSRAPAGDGVRVAG